MSTYRWVPCVIRSVNERLHGDQVVYAKSLPNSDGSSSNFENRGVVCKLVLGCGVYSLLFTRLLVMQIDELGKEFDTLVATLCKVQVSRSNYTEVIKLFSSHDVGTQLKKKLSPEDNVVKCKRF